MKLQSANIEGKCLLLFVDLHLQWNKPASAIKENTQVCMVPFYFTYLAQSNLFAVKYRYETNYIANESGVWRAVGSSRRSLRFQDFFFYFSLVRPVRGGGAQT